LIGDSHAGVLASQLAIGIAATESAPLIYFNTNGLTQSLEIQDLNLIKGVIRTNNFSRVILVANWDRLGMSTQLSHFVRYISQSSKVMVIEDNPVHPYNAFRCAFGLSESISMTQCVVKRYENLNLSAMVEEISGIVYVKTKDLFCTRTHCSMRKGNRINYFDSNHLNENGARILSEQILIRIKRQDAETVSPRL
jgi:hypothetical protein